MFKIFDKLGGREAALDVLEARLGFRPGVNAIKFWRKKRSVSQRATLAFMLECQYRGVQFDLSDCKLPESAVRRRRVRPAQSGVAA